jgi:hypothetical protein
MTTAEAAMAAMRSNIPGKGSAFEFHPGWGIFTTGGTVLLQFRKEVLTACSSADTNSTGYVSCM